MERCVQVVDVLKELQRQTAEVERQGMLLMRQTVAINTKLDRVLEILNNMQATYQMTITQQQQHQHSQQQQPQQQQQQQQQQFHPLDALPVNNPSTATTTNNNNNSINNNNTSSSSSMYARGNSSCLVPILPRPGTAHALSPLPTALLQPQQHSDHLHHHQQQQQQQHLGIAGIADLQHPDKTQHQVAQQAQQLLHTQQTQHHKRDQPKVATARKLHAYPATDIPQLDMIKSLSTVQGVWDEWMKGDPESGVLPIEERERLWPGAGWRKRNPVKQAFHRRKLIVDAIKQRARAGGGDYEEAVAYFEQLRMASVPSSVDHLSKVLRKLRTEAEGGPRKKRKSPSSSGLPGGEEDVPSIAAGSLAHMDGSGGVARAHHMHQHHHHHHDPGHADSNENEEDEEDEDNDLGLDA
eukprot:jgi/Chlat1/6686/Chrsp49S06134